MINNIVALESPLQIIGIRGTYGDGCMRGWEVKIYDNQVRGCKLHYVQSICFCCIDSNSELDSNPKVTINQPMKILFVIQNLHLHEVRAFFAIHGKSYIFSGKYS